MKIDTAHQKLLMEVYHATRAASFLREHAPIFERLSPEACLDAETFGSWFNVICSTKVFADVSLCMSIFPGEPFEKSYYADLNETTYTNSKELAGGRVKLDVVISGPPRSCKLIETVVHVPAHDKKVFKLDCSKEEVAA